MFRYKKGISLSFRPFFSFLYEYFFSCLWFRVLNPPFLPQSKRPSFFFFFGRLKSPHSLYIKANSDVTYHHHHGRRQKKQHVLWLEENDRVRDDGRGVGVVGVGVQSETRRGRGGVFGNVRRRIGRMGEIGSRAIHGCVVSFLLLLLSVFSRARREFVWRFLRLERVLNRSKSRGKDCGASCIEFRSEKKRSRCRSLSYRSNETTASQPKSDDGPGEIDRSTRADDTKQQ